MSKNHRVEYHRAWQNLSPPLRPHPDVVKAISAQIGPSPGRTLLLGVTPELANLTPDLVALDRNISMVMNIWPGNSFTRRAVVGDWRNANFVAGAFSICVGDGSLCGLRFPDEHALLSSGLNRILRPGGKFICRLYIPPDAPEPVSVLRDAALSGAIGNFHAFKFRLSMALAAQHPEFRVGVGAIFSRFSEMFEDRTELVRLTGWHRAHIDTIDFYRGSAVAYYFPPRDAVLQVISDGFAKARLVPSGCYEMAELCPIVVAEKA